MGERTEADAYCNYGLPAGFERAASVTSRARGSEEASYRQGRRETLNQPAFSPADSFGGWGLAPAAPGGISGGRGCYDGL